MKSYLLFSLLIFLVSCTNEEIPSHYQSSYKKINNEINASEMFELDIQTIYRNYQEAVQIAKKENKPIFILFYTKNCRWCSKLKQTTLKNKELIRRLNEDYITLFLNKNEDQYSSLFQVNTVPTIYITNKNGKKITSILGYHSNPRDYIKWFNYVKIESSY